MPTMHHKTHKNISTCIFNYFLHLFSLNFQKVSQSNIFLSSTKDVCSSVLILKGLYSQATVFFLQVICIASIGAIFLMHGALEIVQTGEPLLASSVLDGVFDLVRCNWTNAHQRILEVGAHLIKHRNKNVNCFRIE